MMDIAQMAFVQKMGPLAYPLLFCSLATLMLLIERMMTFLFLPGLAESAVRRMEQAVHDHRWQELELETNKLPMALRDGLGLLFMLADREKTLREEAARVWLRRFARRLQGSLGLLMLLAVVSPLLGLLGTILGMIDAFQSLAAHDGPVHPSLLADGIQEAMLTTAAGLIIAIPALLGVHLFRLAGQKYMQRLEDVFDRLNLALEGIGAVSPAHQPAAAQPEAAS